MRFSFVYSCDNQKLNNVKEKRDRKAGFQEKVMDAKWNRIADNCAVRIELWNSCRVAGDQLRLVSSVRG